MADQHPKQPENASGWQPEMEDGVNSVDGNPEDRDVEVDGVPGNSEDRNVEVDGVPGNSEGRDAEEDGVPGNSQGNRNPEGSHGYQCYSASCTKRRLWLEKEHKRLGSRVQYLQRKLRDKEEALNHALERGREPREKKTERTWPEKLGVEEYGEVYKLSCLEENSNPNTIHPALVFKRRSAALIHRDALRSVEKEIREARNASVLKDLVLDPSRPRHFLEYRMKYSFHDLPGAAQERIFQLLFWYPDRLIHAISRLDPFLEPEDETHIGGKRAGLLNRFHITGKQYGHRCSLTYAEEGNNLLAPLLVSRRFLFLGAHAFYGRNTFAFSSLGKFGRFTQGIGSARTQRLQHIELVWIGAQVLTMEGHSRRTWALASLCEMPRLKNLTVYISESKVRRRDEGIVQMAYLAKKTSGQPSFRLSRDLRTVQGMDYVRQLRGLRGLKFLNCKTGDPVRDWSFTLDLETTCKRNKPYPQHLKSQLESLLPLPRRFNPSEWEWNAARSNYDLGWLPERLPDDHIQDAAIPVIPPGSEVDVRSVSPGEIAAAPGRLHTAAVDLEIGSDGVLAGSVNRAEDLDSVPPFGAANQGVAQSIGAERSETMDIDQVTHGIDPVEEYQLAEIPPAQELDAHSEPQGYQEPMLDHPGQIQGSEADDGLFVVDHSGRTPTEDRAEFNLDEYDFPLPGLSIESEAREKSPKREENMYVGFQPGSPERKPFQDERTDGRGSVDGEGGALVWDGEHSFSFGEHRSSSGEHPPPPGEHSLPPGEHSPPPGEHSPPPREHSSSSGESSSSSGESSSSSGESGEHPSYSGKGPSYSGKRLPSYGGKRLPSQAALKHPPSHGVKRLPSGVGGPSTAEEDEASTSGSDRSSENGRDEGDLDGGDKQGYDFGDEVVETTEVDDVEGGDQGGMEDQHNAAEGALNDGSGSAGTSSTSPEWGGFSPEPEDKSEATAQSGQDNGLESSHTHENAPGSNAKKRPGEDLSSHREKKARSTPE